MYTYTHACVRACVRACDLIMCALIVVISDDKFRPQANVSKAKAIKALKQNKNDPVDAILALSEDAD
jgi:hypothetical protein